MYDTRARESAPCNRFGSKHGHPFPCTVGVSRSFLPPSLTHPRSFDIAPSLFLSLRLINVSPPERVCPGRCRTPQTQQSSKDADSDWYSAAAAAAAAAALAVKHNRTRHTFTRFRRVAGEIPNSYTSSLFETRHALYSPFLTG